MNDPSVIAIIGVLGTTVGALIYIIKFLFNNIIPRLDEGNKFMGKIGEEIRALATTRKAADKYLRDRDVAYNKDNKALIEAVKEIPAKIQETAKITAEVLKKTPKSQIIDKQEVNTQIVNGVK